MEGIIGFVFAIAVFAKLATPAFRVFADLVVDLRYLRILDATLGAGACTHQNSLCREGHHVYQNRTHPRESGILQ